MIFSKTFTYKDLFIKNHLLMMVVILSGLIHGLILFFNNDTSYLMIAYGFILPFIILLPQKKLTESIEMSMFYLFLAIFANFISYSITAMVMV